MKRKNIVKYLYRKRFILRTYVFIVGFPTVTFADVTDIADYPRDTESSIEIEYFSLGDSKSNTGNAQVGTSGVLVQTEYEANDMVFSFNYEKWKYNWTNPENLPFISGIADTPWSTFNTLQFGFAYEQDMNEKWETNYYIQAESSFEKETSNSYEYEAGIGFNYKPSEEWSYTLNVNLDYLDATGAELGGDLEIAWNHDKKEGWSGEFELSNEFPETSLSYHFTRAFSTTISYEESGTNTIRLSDNSPVVGMQGGYFEDEYNSLGIQLDYEFAHESYLVFSFKQISDRGFSFTDRAGKETAYGLTDTSETSIGLLYTF